MEVGEVSCVFMSQRRIFSARESNSSEPVRFFCICSTRRYSVLQSGRTQQVRRCSSMRIRS